MRRSRAPGSSCQQQWLQAACAEAPPAAAYGKGKSKGKGKGKAGRKEARGWKSTLNSRTPDGREKCYKFQEEQCKGGCGRVHVRLICDGPYPMIQCSTKPQKGGKGDAAGHVK